MQLATIPGHAVEPNPRVGAIIAVSTPQPKIIAEGWHAVFGGAHAEVAAIESAMSRLLPAEASLYVTLEPCCHRNKKTPPCTDLIIEKQIRRVVVGCLDPNPAVSGKGIAALKAAGIEVVMAADPAPFEKLIAHFLVNQQQQRAYCTLKWAQTRDGYIGNETAAMKISSLAARIETHQLRRQHRAILVGYRTALTDNPLLDARYSTGPDPVRVVLDPLCQLPPDLHLFNSRNDQPVIVINTLKTEIRNHIHYFKFVADTPAALLTALYQDLGIGSVLVEGGSQTINRFLSHNCWDLVYRWQSLSVSGGTVAAPDAQHLDWKLEKQLITDQLWVSKRD
jgi:diaminohydroxyphosphoribosylaminopyrimidine deaminase/5-amino-6-(5-phosphoribosylamino)uracil reductase